MAKPTRETLSPAAIDAANDFVSVVDAHLMAGLNLGGLRNPNIALANFDAVNAITAKPSQATSVIR